MTRSTDCPYVCTCIKRSNIRNNVVKYTVCCEHKYMIYMSMCKHSKNNIFWRSSSWILFSACVGICQSTSLANAHCTVISVCGRSRGSRNAAVKLCCSRGKSDDVRCFHICF